MTELDPATAELRACPGCGHAFVTCTPRLCPACGYAVMTQAEYDERENVPLPTTAASEYELTVRFGAADDGQAERLARAWAGTIEAEFGATFVALRKVVESD